MSINSISRNLAVAGIKHVVVTAKPTKSSAFKANWTPTEVKLIGILRNPKYFDDGIELETLRQMLAGRSWLDLKKIPAPVDRAIDNLVDSWFAMRVHNHSGEWRILPVPGIEKQIVEAGAYSPGPVSAEIRRSRDNKLFRSVVETDTTTAVKFIKHITDVCEQVEDSLGEECYIYWNGAKYLADNGKLKSAGQALKRFQERAYAKQAQALTEPRYGKYPPIDYQKASQTLLKSLSDVTVRGKYMELALVDAGVILGRLFKRLRRDTESEITIKEITEQIGIALDKIMKPLEESKKYQSTKTANASSDIPEHKLKSVIESVVLSSSRVLDYVTLNDVVESKQVASILRHGIVALAPLS